MSQTIQSRGKLSPLAEPFVKLQRIARMAAKQIDQANLVATQAGIVTSPVEASATVPMPVQSGRPILTTSDTLSMRASDE